MMTPHQRKFYNMGARLHRTGKWGVARVVSWCFDQHIARSDRLWVATGCKDEARCNPEGVSGRPLGDPDRRTEGRK